MKKKNHIINVITLGCSKNLVDSEVLMKQLAANNLTVVHDSDRQDAKTIIINTCGFINDAKEESINTILQFVQAKKQGLIENLYVMGCLSERYKEDLKKEIPEVDQFFGVNSLEDIVKTAGAQFKKELLGERMLSTPAHFAYLKISEGCDRTCAFCAIPLIRGKHQSKPIEVVIEEAEKLVKDGVKELILIAQDLSYYGLDIYKEQRIAELIKKLSDLKGVDWIRIHYLYPANFPFEILPLIHLKKNVCKYIDIALQHISDNMLLKMKRNISKVQTYQLIEKIRKEVPGIKLRTSIMVGHPGETLQDFDELKQFVKDIQFDRLGVFIYSEEEDTYSQKHYRDDISMEVKQQRMDEIMMLQQDISDKLNSQFIGKTISVLIDRKEEEFYVGRTEFDSPEIDNEVLIPVNGNKLKTGVFYNVKITKTEEYDLYGDVDNSI